MKNFHKALITNSQKGMTLIEIIIVVALIGTMMAYMITNVIDRADEAKVDQAKIGMGVLQQHLTMYRVHNNRYPTSSQGLAALVTNPGSSKNWRGPYTEQNKLLDPWGEELSYESDGRSFKIISGGQDMSVGTEDDIQYPEEQPFTSLRVYWNAVTVQRNINKLNPKLPPGLSGGFSLIEIIIVLGLIMFIYAVALPNFGMTSSAAIASKLGQFGGDVRNAYDLSVLSGKTYRMVVEMNTGDYWLEVADRKNIKMATDGSDRDLNPDEEKERQAAFDDDFAEYEELSGLVVVDPETDLEIKPESPVTTAKEKLRPPQWRKVDAMEWGARSLGPELMVTKMQAEHHANVQDLLEIGENAVGMIYFFPSGYVERSYLNVYYRDSDMVPDEGEEPYTIIINPNEGTAEITTGLKEIDVHEDQEI